MAEPITSDDLLIYGLSAVPPKRRKSEYLCHRLGCEELSAETLYHLAGRIGRPPVPRPLCCPQHQPGGFLRRPRPVVKVGAKLNIGCGKRPLPSWTNADLYPGPGVDLVFDAGAPWPLPDASCDLIRIVSVLEHLPRWELAVLEAARVLRPGGELRVSVPYGLRILTEPYHVRAFDRHTFDIFIDGQRIRRCDLRQETNPDTGGCEAVPRVFRRLRQDVLHLYPFSWHVARILGDRAYAFPLSRKRTLREVLVRL